MNYQGKYWQATQGRSIQFFCKTGDRVSRDQRVMKVYLLDENTHAEIYSPFDGETQGSMTEK